MKKYIFGLLLLISISCSKTENETVQVTQSCINPPTWLQGTWVVYNKNQPTEIESKYIITSSNITSQTYSVATNWGEIYCNKAPLITIKEEDKNTHYLFQWTQTYAGQTIVNDAYFIKQSQPNKMMFNNYLDNDGTIYTKL